MASENTTRALAAARRALMATALALAACCLLAFLPQSAFATGETVVHDAMTFQVTADASEDNGWVAEVKLTSDNNNDSEEVVLGEFEKDGTTYRVTAIGASAFEGNETVKSVTIQTDLTGSSPAVGTSAFKDCTSLESVSFPAKVAGIGTSAFEGCTALASVTFPEGAELYTTSAYNDTAIKSYAFKGCTSLTAIAIPAITSSTRFADLYYRFDEYNPLISDDSSVISQTMAIITSFDKFIYSSLYQSWWHSGAAPVCRPGIDAGIFDDCTSLETVVFKAGASLGAYTYFWQSTSCFSGCENLKSVVFEAEQAYAIDPNGGNHNAELETDSVTGETHAASASDFWSDLSDDDDHEDPTLYYAVDFYATDDKAVVDADDEAASGRLARVELKRGTSTSSIGSGNVAEDDVFADASLYAGKDEDGTVPDPNEAAEAVGLDTSKTWAWKLTDSQSQREGLTDSCKAYLVEASDVSAGRIGLENLTELQYACDQNYSRWIVDGVERDCTFDVERFYNPVETIKYDGTANIGTRYTISDDAYLTVNSDLNSSFYSKLSVVAADGTELGSDQYALAFQRYDSEEGALLEAESLEVALAELGEEGGPLLVTVTPTEDSGYTGALQEWILVKGNTGSVRERFTDSSSGSAGTWYQATVTSEVTGSVTTYTGPYAVQVGGSDLTSALVATAFAGLAEAPINVADSGKAHYGFTLNSNFYSANGVINSSGTGSYVTFSSEGYDAATFAVASYNALDGVRLTMGIEDTDEYQWGSTALLIDQSALNEVAAAAAALAYAAKAPVFYVGTDGTVSADTLACLADFDNVVLLGYSSTFTDEVIEGLEATLGEGAVSAGTVSAYLNASSLSIAVADTLMASGLADAAVVTVSDAADPFDAIGALNRSGHSGGLTLVSASSADSKQVALYLRAMRDDVNTVRLFGRSDSNALTSGYDLGDALQNLWDETGSKWSDPAVRSGDTIEISGLLFALSGSGGTSDAPFTLTYKSSLWGDDSLAAGTYAIDGIYYTLETAVGSGGGSDGDDGDDQSSVIDVGSLVDVTSASSLWSSATKIQWATASQTSSSNSSDNAATSDDADSTDASSDDASTTSTATDTTTTGTTTTTSSSTASTSEGLDVDSLNLNTQLEDPDGDSDDTATGGVSEVDDDEDDGTSSLNPVTNVGDITDNGTGDEDSGEEDGEGDQGGEETASGGVSPVVVGVIVAAVVAALGVGAWYVLRRRNSADPLDDDLSSAA